MYEKEKVSRSALEHIFFTGKPWITNFRSFLAMLNVYDNKSNSHLVFDYLANNRSKNQNMFLDVYLNYLIRNGYCMINSSKVNFI